MKYVKLFKNLASAKAEGKKGLSSPHVDIIRGFDVTNFHMEDNDKFICNFDSNGKIIIPDHFISFTSSAEQTTTLVDTFGGDLANIQYSYDKTNWSNWDYSEGSATQMLTFGSSTHPSIYFRGMNTSGFSIDEVRYVHFEFSGEDGSVDVGGNLMSLINYEELPSVIPNMVCFIMLFMSAASLRSVSKYFLPAETLLDYCYTSMFQGCTSLTNAPELPATTLKNFCYGNMFNGCTALSSVTCLATDVSASNCTQDWLQNTSSTGVFYTPSSTSWTTGTSGIPSNWTRKAI